MMTEYEVKITLGPNEDRKLAGTMKAEDDPGMDSFKLDHDNFTIRELQDCAEAIEKVMWLYKRFGGLQKFTIIKK